MTLNTRSLNTRPVNSRNLNTRTLNTRTLRLRPVSATPLTAAAAPARIPYLPGLDGIRALAVLAVVLYHLGVAAVPGGFLGVDVFFVLSGFLITGSLVAEHARSGGVDLGRFLLRRARRLLPALWLMLLAVCTAAVLVFRGELGELRTDVPAALLYVSNWASLAGEQSYFEAVGRPPLLQHLWSLAIEGQFYVVWPIAVVLVFRFGGPARVARVARVALVGAVLSTALMAVLAVEGGFPIPNDPSPAYLGSASHAMGLLLGAALGAVWAPWRTTASASTSASRGGLAPWWLELVGVAGLIGLVAAFWWVDALSFALYRGGFAAVSIVAAMVVCAVAHPGSQVGRLLGIQPWRYFGQRSYGIYLWHWPVFMLTRPGFELAFDGVAASVVRVALALLLAEASYRWVEVPVRSGALGRWVTRLRVEGLEAGGRLPVRIVAGPVALGVLVIALTTALAAPPVVAREPGHPVSVIVRQAAPDLEPAPPVAAEPAPTPAGSVVPPADPPADPAPAPAAPPPAPAAPAAPPLTTVVGDSVMAAIAPALTARFPALEVDAVTSRQPGGVLDALAAISAAGRLGQVVVIGAGTNGAIAEGQLRAMLELARPARRVIVLNDHVARDWEGHNNELIGRVVPEYPNAIVFDWKALATAHPEWLWTDGIHPRPAGADAIAAMFLAEAVSVAA